MIQHCPVLIVLLPLTAALLCLLFSKFNKNLGSWLVIGSIAGSLACSLQVLHQTLTSGEAIHYWKHPFYAPSGFSARCCLLHPDRSITIWATGNRLWALSL